MTIQNWDTSRPQNDEVGQKKTLTYINVEMLLALIIIMRYCMAKYHLSSPTAIL